MTAVSDALYAELAGWRAEIPAGRGVSAGAGHFGRAGSRNGSAVAQLGTSRLGRQGSQSAAASDDERRGALERGDSSAGAGDPDFSQPGVSVAPAGGSADGNGREMDDGPPLPGHARVLGLA